ncbi:hypothetical protein J3Q64DRAFT_1838457 [Phycomyces blakesleeanus]|uniref:Uncharacterized protein n=1 Tax=Phycomyces blakesleeanus TaxID=4837 RepID=A0ABR3ATF3_PHYBL
MDHMYEEIEDFWHYLSKAMRPRDINMYMTLDRFFTLTSEIALADISICSVEASVEKFEKAFNEKLATKIIPEKYLVLYSRKLSISKHNNEVTTLIDEATSSIIQVNIKTRKKPGSEYKKMPEYKYIKNLLEKDSEDVALISENPYWYIAPHNAAEDQLIISNCGITTKYIADNQTGKDLPKQTKYQDTVFQEYDSIKDNLDEGFNYFKTGYRQEFIETLVEVAGIQLKAREIEKQV